MRNILSPFDLQFLHFSFSSYKTFLSFESGTKILSSSLFFFPLLPLNLIGQVIQVIVSLSQNMAVESRYYWWTSLSLFDIILVFDTYDIST